MIARSLLLATALLAASRRARRSRRRRDDVIAAPVLRANVTVSGDLVRIGDVIDNAGTRRADRDLSRARSRHHRLAADRAGAQRAARPSGDRRRHQGSQGNFGDAAGPHARGQGHRAAGRARAGAPQRPWRRRQSQPDLRPRSAAMSGSMPPTPAACRRPSCATIRATAASTSPSRSPTRTAPRRPSCASPAPRSRPSRPRCWRAMSSATKS